MAENHYDLDYTGSMVDRILDTGYDLQNQGYIFRGLASHYTGTPTERTWLIAPTGSTGFGLSSPVPPGSIGICMYNGSSWSAEVLNTLTLDSAPTAGSGNGITSGAVKTLAESITNAIGQLEQSVSDRFTSMELEDTTGSLQAELLSITLKYVFEGEEETLTSLSILAATAEKAGLMSAADKQKLDAFVTNIRSLRIQDTTAQADQGTEITNTLKWTIGGVTEAITAFTLYAATTSKAGLMSAADKTALDTLPSLINAGYLYAGIATPSTVPSSTSAKIYYIAIDGGTYTNFGNLNVTQGINIIYKSGDAWSVAQVVGIDNEPTAGSDNLVKSGGVKTELALGAVYDVSAHHNGATFESLSALLSDTDLNALIPTAVRKGGMSIKFVQSSDNKYVQCRLIADEFTTDITQWVIADEGVYVENPEFVYVKTDNEGKILWAIKTDGSIYYGAGVPQQVVDYINESIAELSLDEYEDIVAFLNNLEKGDKTLQTLLNEKVYKEEGKSLIDSEYASTKSTINNPEFLETTLDTEGKVLEGIQTDGTKVIGGDLNVGGSASVSGDINVLGNMEVSGVSYKAIENPEYLAAWVDAEYKVIFGLKTDGKTYVGDADFLNEIKNNKKAISEINSIIASINSTIDSLDIDALSSITAVETPEFIEAKTDSEGKLLAGRTPDGAAFEKIGFSAPKVSIDEHIVENIEDIEGRSEITTDSEGKIISYIDVDGVKHESVGIETPILKADKIESDSTYTIDVTDVKDTIYAERPKCGEIWFEGNLPTDTSDQRTPTWLTMTFKNSGVPQFKCKCTLAIQGHGSVAYAKKGYTLEPYNEDGDAINLKFGNMIAVDSLHLKAYATDSLHCRDMANFNIWRDIVKKLEYPSSKFNNIPFSFVSYNKNKINTADAMYAPDGFPVVCYLNGEFLGLYTLKLKKTRQNYAMEKSVKSEILMDAISGASNLYHGFDHTGWDLKNPKIKNYEEGGEITDATVLASINRFFDWVQQIDKNVPTTYSNYADYMVFPHWIAYMLFEELIASYDTGSNNVLLATWDATHWSMLPYDTDLTVGLHPWEDIYPTGQPYTILTELDCFVFTRQTTNVFPIFEEIFEEDLKGLWTELRNSGFITPSNIVQYYVDQCKAVPRDIYEKDYEKWGTIWTNGVPSIEQLYTFMNNRIAWLDSQWLNQN